MATIEVFDPTAEPRIIEQPLAGRPKSLEHKRIGLLSNKKANAGLLLREIESLLRDRGGELAVYFGEKGAAVPASDDVMEGLSRCDVVVTAIAD